MAENGQDTSSQNSGRVLERNIEALLERRREQEKALSWQDKLAERVASFAGNMGFVWLHVIIYGTWFLINLGLVPGVAPFDPTFVILAMIASVEAIFLSTFILITQNRMQAQADRRADLNLQINLLAEHEITRLIKMVMEIGDRLDIRSAKAAELSELKRYLTCLSAVRPKQGSTTAASGEAPLPEVIRTQ
jgi:uncharacterized membrane protein